MIKQQHIIILYVLRMLSIQCHQYHDQRRGIQILYLVENKTLKVQKY